MGKTNSSLLGFMTSMMYYNADLWESVNVLSLNNMMMREKITHYDTLVYWINELFTVFTDLQETDYDLLYQKHKSELIHLSSEEKFDYLEDQAMILFESLQERATIIYENNGGIDDPLVHALHKISVDNIMLRKVVYSSYRKVFT